MAVDSYAFVGRGVSAFKGMLPRSRLSQVWLVVAALGCALKPFSLLLSLSSCQTEQVFMNLIVSNAIKCVK